MDPNKPVALHLDPKVTNQVPLVIRELGVKPALRLFLAQNHVTDMKTLKPILQVHASAHSRPRGRDLCQGTGGTPGFVLERDETKKKGPIVQGSPLSPKSLPFAQETQNRPMHTYRPQCHL